MKQTLKAGKPGGVIVEAADVEYCDGSGVALLFELGLHGRAQGFGVEIRGLRDEFEQLLGMFDPADFSEPATSSDASMDVSEEVGTAAVNVWAGAREMVTFVGELSAALARAAVMPWRVRWKDAFLAAEFAGANAVGIVLLIGALFGLILAFSSAMPLTQFGAEVYVADLVALALLRVLGPFITAILVAGRSGSAFAAELGTMKINDEIDALTTMGLDPVRFLVVPRVLASIVVLPLLTIMTNLAGLVGSAVVILSLDFPLVTYVDHVRAAVGPADVLTGLFKAVVYGGLVGGVSCLRGLQTKTGASAVGLSTTRAVVSSIVLLVAAEGVFSVLFYYLDL